MDLSIKSCIIYLSYVDLSLTQMNRQLQGLPPQTPEAYRCDQRLSLQLPPIEGATTKPSYKVRTSTLSSRRLIILLLFTPNKGKYVKIIKKERQRDTEKNEQYTYMHIHPYTRVYIMYKYMYRPTYIHLHACINIHTII